jgi:hypothetical protein
MPLVGRSWQSLIGLVFIITKAIGPGLLISLLCWGGFAVAGQAPLSILCCAAAMFFFSLFLHEMGHILAFWSLSALAPAIFTAQKGRFRLIRGSLPLPRDLLVTLAGPAAPLLIVLAAAPVAGTHMLEFLMAVAVAVGHLTALTRADGDGAALRLALTAARSRAEARMGKTSA